MRIALSVPAGNERGPLYMDQALAAIHQANPHRLPFSLELARHRDGVGLACSFPPELRPIIEGQLFAHYPDAKIEAASEEPTLSTDHRVWIAELTLTPDLFPIRRYGEFADGLNRTLSDPLAALLATLAYNSPGTLIGRVELSVRPTHPSRHQRALRCLAMLSRPFLREHLRLARLYLSLGHSPRPPSRVLAWMIRRTIPKSSERSHPPLTVSASRSHEREDDFQAAADKLAHHLFDVQARLVVSGPESMAKAAGQRLREMAGSFGVFSSPRLATVRLVRVRAARHPPGRHRGPRFLLSTEELATLWHPPTQAVRAEKMARVESRAFEPPAILPTPKTQAALAILGETAFRSRRERFGILPDDRLRHIYIAGKTGMGKSTLLANLLLSDIAAGHGVALIDPHGDLAESLLPALPRNRTNDVILFDAGDAGHPLAFNPLHCPDAASRPLVASGIVSAFKKLYGDSWGPRLEHILRNALLALLEVPGSTLVSILRLLSEPKYRQAIVSQLGDPIVRGFWEREFAAMHPKLQTEAIAPIQNKVGHFVSSPLLRNILGQSQNRLHLRRVMDNRAILIVNLSKGCIGEDSSALLGSLLVTSLQIAAMSRADIPERGRQPFHVYVDEFQNFATDSFATILSEARKYRLSLTLANQYLDQVGEATAAAVFGNVGTLLSFQVGANDAAVLAEQLGGEMTPSDLMQLPRHHAYARLLIDGHPSRPFSLRTLPPATKPLDPRRAEIIRRYSRQRYGRRSADVEADYAMAFARQRGRRRFVKVSP